MWSLFPGVIYIYNTYSLMYPKHLVDLHTGDVYGGFTESPFHLVQAPWIFMAWIWSPFSSILEHESAVDSHFLRCTLSLSASWRSCSFQTWMAGQVGSLIPMAAQAKVRTAHPSSLALEVILKCRLCFKRWIRKNPQRSEISIHEIDPNLRWVGPGFRSAVLCFLKSRCPNDLLS